MKVISTPEAPAAIGPYSQAVEIQGFLYLSGQIPLNPETGTLEGTDIETQTKQVMKNIAAVLKAAGTDFTHVVKTTCFLKNMSDFTVFNTIYADYFVSRPARSCVAVATLPKDALVEVEVVAVLQEKW
ncbi:MAG: RidA family protein [Planctomycetia bacterium]|nr:RidA family protein [Planctomycetia bacterium]